MTFIGNSLAARLAAVESGKQAANANLTAVSNMTGDTNKLPYFSDSTTLTTTDITAAGRALLDDADAAAQRVTLGVFSYLAYDAYSSGSAYSLTATPAALAFGTTSPSITIATPGTYRIRGRSVLKYNGATFAANRTATLKFRRTNNTAADLTNGGTSVLTNIISTLTGIFVVVTLPEIEYVTANSNDVLTIFGDVSAIPTLGSLDATEASIHAIRVA